jgi:hypothetical protein
VTTTAADLKACADAMRLAASTGFCNLGFIHECGPKPGTFAKGTPCGEDLQCASG